MNETMRQGNSRNTGSSATPERTPAAGELALMDAAVIQQQQDRAGRIPVIERLQADQELDAPLAGQQPVVPLARPCLEKAEHRLLAVNPRGSDLLLFPSPLILTAD